jgi:hypothetical protein
MVTNYPIIQCRPVPHLLPRTVESSPDYPYLKAWEASQRASILQANQSPAPCIQSI